MNPLLASLRAIVLQASDLFIELVPYVLAGAALGAALRNPSRFHFIERLPSWRLHTQIILASLIGTLSPLCTLGTVPLLVGLVGRGFPAPAALAFLGASSMANPQILILTVGALGSTIAIVNWVAALLVGISAGSLALWATKYGQNVFKPILEKHDSSHHRSHKHGKGGFWQAFLEQLEYVALYLVIGVLAAAALSVLTPGRYFEQWLGPDNRFAIVLSSILAVPFYVCGGGILPVMQALMEKGIPAGVVVAFLISGPATRVQALSALAALLKMRMLVVYVGLVMAWAIGLGMICNALVTLK